MADINPSIPASGELNSTADPKIRTALNLLIATINDLGESNLADSAVTADKIATAAAVDLGLSQTGAARRGSCAVATEEARTNTAYGKLATPDEVSNIVLPADGLIFVAYQAEWKQSVADAASAAIFLEAVQAQIAPNGTAGGPGVQAAQTSGAGAYINFYAPLFTTSRGLRATVPAAGAYTGDVTTGQILGATYGSSTEDGGGGACAIFAAAGTYDISVQFKASSGTVTAKNRHLWVWTMGF